ncbi:MAG: M23 family metallopeptidase [Rhodobacteraceae bacterium]|nr:M23 family metallopeptidase [Paracoccaceae bacterium]
MSLQSQLSSASTTGWRRTARLLFVGAAAAILAACAAKPPAPKIASVDPSSSVFKPDARLSLCPKVQISNAPPADNLQVLTYKPFVEPAPGLKLAVAPTNGACLSSGYGPRRGKLHKGIDLHSRKAPMIVAAADGVVVQKKYRDDYGNMVVIDHGDGVYTRYAHLAQFHSRLQQGDKVAFGAPLGPMGRTSKWPVALHLHYEILLGDIGNPKGSFGLSPYDPLGPQRVAQN